MRVEVKVREFVKIQALIKNLIAAVESDPPNMEQAGSMYNDIKKWYHTVQHLNRDAD